MVVYVDLSASQLHPAAVLQLIEAHRKARPPHNILFKVSRKTALAYHRTWPKTWIPVSKEEAQKINAFLRTRRTVRDYLVDGEMYCSKCNRQLTFYDLFTTGLQEHGEDHMRRILAGGDCNIQVAAKHHQAKIRCTMCGTINVATVERMRRPGGSPGVINGDPLPYVHYHSWDRPPDMYCYV